MFFVTRLDPLENRPPLEKDYTKKMLKEFSMLKSWEDHFCGVVYAFPDVESFERTQEDKQAMLVNSMDSELFYGLAHQGYIREEFIGRFGRCCGSKIIK